MSAKTKADEEPVADSPQTESEPPPTARSTAYFGVARNLSLASAEKRDPTCSCVAAVVGPASDPAFKWHGETPAVGGDALVVAISSEGVACGHHGHGPSIKAIDRAGEDVVVVLEEYHASRPQALGAIIPNPGGNGRVYLRAHGRTPYGRPIGAGSGPHGHWCLVGKGAGAGVIPRDQKVEDKADDKSHDDD